MKTATPLAAASPVIAIAICSLAILMLTAMDAVVKTVVIVVGVYNTVFWRSIISASIAGGAWVGFGRRAPTPVALRLHVLRAAMMGIVMLLFFWALARLPLAEVIALSFIAPLFALVLAGLLLGERIRRSTIWASLGCMVGVGVIVVGKLGPSTYRHDAMLGVGAVLISTLFYAYSLILARRQAIVARPLEIVFFQNLALAVMLACAAPWLATTIPVELWPHVAVITALSMAGQWMMSWSYGRAEAQYLIPTEYTAFVWAILLGWYFFDEMVTTTTLAGAGLIIAGCMAAAMSSSKLPQPVEATI